MITYHPRDVLDRTTGNYFRGLLCIDSKEDLIKFSISGSKELHFRTLLQIFLPVELTIKLIAGQEDERIDLKVDSEKMICFERTENGYHVHCADSEKSYMYPLGIEGFEMLMDTLLWFLYKKTPLKKNYYLH